jgi:hypothetical protein
VIPRGVTDGFRTRDSWSHNPALYQLSYGHQKSAANHSRPRRPCKRNPRPCSATKIAVQIVTAGTAAHERSRGWGGGTNLGFVATNLGFVATNLGFVATNLGFVATNLGFVATNLGFVATNLGFVATNLGFVATNLGFVATNLGFVASMLAVFATP